MEDEFEKSIEITYTVIGFDELGETTFDMEVSNRVFQKLQDAEDEGEYLDSEYISENMHKIHKKILRAIRNDMEEKGMDPDDGMVEKRYSWGAPYKEYNPVVSYSEMQCIADDEDIDYTIYLY